MSRVWPAGTGSEIGSPCDREAFDRDALGHRAELHQYALRLTRSPADADDLVQETLLRALRSWRSFTPGTRLGPWLRTILYRAFVNQFHTRGRFETLADLDTQALAERSPDSATVDPETEFDLQALRETLSRAVARLSPEQQDAVGLSDVEGYTGDEVAAVLGVPLGTVKSRLRRARRLLRRSLCSTASELGYGWPSRPETGAAAARITVA